ncbi:MAG TPA: hypothetical protein VMC62_07965 [Longilinea sp.]|nr:hypothetical protein [Longilinea sp.]
METPIKEGLPPPPGLIASLAAGFDTTASHASVILIPVLLDLFIWLGPHLRIEMILRPLLAAFQALPPSQEATMTQDILRQFTQDFNLISIVRTLPVGIPSLLAGTMPLTNPFGNAVWVNFTDTLQFIEWWLALTLAGWIGGGLYYNWVSRVTMPVKKPSSLRNTTHAIAQTIVLSLLWMLTALAVGIPVFMLLGTLALISPGIAQFALLLGLFFFLWALPAIFFSAHGIFAYEQTAVASMRSSLRMMRFTLPASGLFLLGAFLISQGLTLLWEVPPTSSWMTLIGIVGHAFISSALMAASFVYYRNVNSWLQLVMEKFKTQATSARA